MCCEGWFKLTWQLQAKLTAHSWYWEHFCVVKTILTHPTDMDSQCYHHHYNLLAQKMLAMLLLNTASGNVGKNWLPKRFNSSHSPCWSRPVAMWFGCSKVLIFGKTFHGFFMWIFWWIFLLLISLAEAVVRDLLNLSKIHQIINAIGRMNFLKRLPSWYLTRFEILWAWLPNTSSIQFAQFRRKYSDKCR